MCRANGESLLEALKAWWRLLPEGGGNLSSLDRRFTAFDGSELRERWALRWWNWLRVALEDIRLVGVNQFSFLVESEEQPAFTVFADSFKLPDLPVFHGYFNAWLGAHRAYSCVDRRDAGPPPPFNMRCGLSSLEGSQRLRVDLPDTELDLDLSELEGIGPATKRKLNEAGIETILDLAVALPAELVELGLGEDNAGALVFVAQRKLKESGLIEKEFISASEALERRQKMLRCTTGAKNLDRLLKGGIETQAITELWGEFGAGKSQLCHMLCINAQLPPQKGGLGGAAIYLDTESTFRPERIYEMATARELDHHAILNRIYVVKIYNSSHLELAVKTLGGFIDKFKARLVVVDSIISLHRAEFTGRGNLAERQQRLNALIHRLLRVAEVFNVAMVVTNQVQTQPDMFFGDPTRPAGGHVIAHACTYRLYLRKAKNSRIATMIDSPYHPVKDALFTITERGIEDCELPEKKAPAFLKEEG